MITDGVVAAAVIALGTGSTTTAKQLATIAIRMMSMVTVMVIVKRANAGKGKICQHGRFNMNEINITSMVSSITSLTSVVGGPPDL